MDVDDDDAPFELTEQDDLALANAYAHAHALPDAQAQAFDGSVVEIDAVNFNFLRKCCGIDSKTVVLGCDLNAA